MKTVDNKTKLPKRGFSGVSFHPAGWTQGQVFTPYGIVSVYAQGDEKNRNYTRLLIVLDGYLHSRIFNDKRYSPRGIFTKALEFAAEVAGFEDRKEPL